MAVGHNILEDTGTPIYCWWLPQFFVPEGHEILKVTIVFVAIGHNILEVTGTPIHGCSLPQFLVPEGHKILEVTGDYVIC